MVIANSSNAESLETDNIDEEVLLLEKPCEYYKLLHLDEAKHGEAVRYK